MLFAIVLGMIVGGAGVLLVQQWLTGSLMLGHRPARDAGFALPSRRFPHLAPSRRAVHRRAA